MDNQYTYSIDPHSRLQVSLHNGVTTVQLQTISSTDVSQTAQDARQHTAQHHTAQHHTAQTSHSFTTGQWHSAPIFTQQDHHTVTVLITAEQTHHIHCQNGHLSVSSEPAHTINNNSASAAYTTSSTTVSSTTVSSTTTHTTTISSASSS